MVVKFKAKRDVPFKVTLISYERDAMNKLLFTRNTRLEMTPEGIEEIRKWSEDRKREELEHALYTIQSSWAFINYTFLLTGVSRSFTHQLVRHGVGTAFAQQSLRTVDAADFKFHTGPSIQAHEQVVEYRTIMAEINAGYKRLKDMGVSLQDARGVLPTDIKTNILFQANLRTLHDMALKRLCPKTQGEFQEVFLAIRKRVLEVHYWAEPFIRVNCAFTGTCAFHDWPVENCQIKGQVYNPDTCHAYNGGKLASKNEIQGAWNEMDISSPQPRRA